MPGPTILRWPSVFAAPAILARDRYNPAAPAHLERGGVAQETGPFPGQRTARERADPLVDIPRR
jgi:hypothetical protein